MKLIANPIPNNPTLPLRWCLDTAELVKLREIGVALHNVFVLIVVAYCDGCTEDRYLRPLDEAMYHIPLRMPGKHRIFARLVWASDVSWMRNCLLTRSDRRTYGLTVLNYDRTEMIGPEWMTYVSDRVGEFEPAGIDAEMDREFFAPEHASWAKWWVNLWFTLPPVDQCHFRKRAIFCAFNPFAQPLVIGVWLAIRSLFIIVWAAICLVLGARGLTLKPILHPWTSDLPDDVWPLYPGHVRRSFFLHNKNGAENDKRLLMHPLVWAAMWLILYRIAQLVNTTSLTLLAGIAAIVAACVVVWLIVQYFKPIRRMLDRVFTVFDRFYAPALNRLDVWTGALVEAIGNSAVLTSHRKKVALREDAREKAYLHEVQTVLGCPVVSQIDQPARLDALPPSRRTYQLRFLDLKARMCKLYPH